MELCYDFSYDDKSLHNFFPEFEKSVISIINNDRTWKDFLVSSETANPYANPLFTIVNEPESRIPIRLIKCPKSTTCVDGACDRHECKGIRIVNNKVVFVNEPHVIFTLARTAYINTHGCPGLEKNKRQVTPLSCTISSPHLIKIFINFENWQNGFDYALSKEGIHCANGSCVRNESFGNESYNNYFLFISNPELKVSLYRDYVINHELGHALNRDHYYANRARANSSKLLPIMVQQTKGFYGYKINVWPLPEE
jgi:hypothetical protein